MFTGRKADLTPGLRTFTEDKLARLERILHESPDAHVVLTREKHRHLAEIVVHARIGTLTARANGAEFEESLGLAIDRLLAQARKQHSKMAKGRKRRAMRESPRRGASATVASISNRSAMSMRACSTTAACTHGELCSGWWARRGRSRRSRWRTWNRRAPRASRPS